MFDFKFGLYDVQTLELVHDLSSFKNSYDLTTTIGGNIDGEVTFEFWNKAGEFLPIGIDKLFHNSHFVKLGAGKVYPAVIEGMVTNTSNANLFTLQIKSFKSYTEEIELLPFYRATQDSLTLEKDDESNVINIYGNNEVSILRNILYNNQMVMQQRGYNSGLIDFSALDSFMVPVGDSFTKSYRINGFELQSLSVAIEDLLGETSQLISITTSQDLASLFSFTYEIIDTADVKTVNLGNGTQFYDVSFDNLNKKSKSEVVISGTDIIERQRLERRRTGESVAFSSLLGESQSERTDTLGQEVENIKKRVISLEGTITLSSQWVNLEVMDFVTFEEWNGLVPINSTVLRGIVTEKNTVSGRATYSVQISAIIDEIFQVHQNENGVQRIIFSTLKNTQNLAIRTSKSKNSSLVTGWRQ